MTDDVDVKLDLFEQLYISVLNERAPIVERRVKTIKQPPWFNADLARLIMARDRLFNDPRARRCIRLSRIMLIMLIIKFKRRNVTSTSSHLNNRYQNPRVIWNHINSSLATRSAVQQRQTNCQLHPHTNIMADKLKNNFGNIASKFSTTTTSVPNYSKLHNFISRSKPEIASFKLSNMTTEFVLNQL